MPNYIYKIKIPWAEIGCNPHLLTFRVEESEEGARKLFFYLDETFDRNSVEMLEDTSPFTRTHEHVLGYRLGGIPGGIYSP